MSQIFHRSDTETPCGECSREKFERWQFDCHRGEFADRILDLALGTGEWVLYDEYEDEEFRCLIEYDTISARTIFRDFRGVPGRTTALSHPPIPLADFLAQFENMESRWPGHFEPYTVELIKRCAMFQAALLARRESSLEDLPDESIPIALSLRCLVLTHEIMEVGGTMPACIRDEDEERTDFQKYHDEDPLIDVVRVLSREPGCPARAQVDSEEHIPALLENLVQTLQRLIMRQDPREWPLILCTLCIFEQISNNYFTHPDPMSLLGLSSEAISSTYSALCHWFHVCSQKLQPLTDSWEKEAFAKVVDEDSLLLDVFQWLNDGWLQGSSEYANGIPESVPMVKRVTSVSAGYALGIDF